MDLIRKLQFCDALDQCYTFQSAPIANCTVNKEFSAGSFDNVETVGNETDTMQILRFEDRSV